MTCGDLKNGFARVRCGDCRKEYLLAFSCKGRWFCPSCHAKKVVQFGDVLHETILYPVPHRHYVFSIPIMLRIYFKHDRALLTKLCQCAYHSLLIFLQNVIGLQDGVPGVVLSLHTFGDYPEKFHPHIHAIVSDGLFLKTGAFYVMPDVDLKPLEEMFRAKVFTMLKEEGKIDDHIIKKGYRRPGRASLQAIEIIDVSEYKPRRIPSKQWRDCIKKIYEADPLCCPKCGGEIHPVRYCDVTDRLTCEKNGSFYGNLMLDICYLTG